MSCHQPTPQRLCPPLPTQHPPRPKSIAPWLPMGPYQARGMEITLTVADSFIWDNEFNTSENRVLGGGLALGGHRFMI
jgi:hypothetical protein